MLLNHLSDRSANVMAKCSFHKAEWNEDMSEIIFCSVTDERDSLDCYSVLFMETATLEVTVVFPQRTKGALNGRCGTFLP